METKKMTLALDATLSPWLAYTSGLADTSVTGYINDLIRRDRDAATGDVREGYDAFVRAREQRNGTTGE
jgi:hypothetical protein